MGAKLEAYKAIKQALRNSVRDSDTRPNFVALDTLQRTYLLDKSQAVRYVVEQNPCQLDRIRCLLAAFLIFKAGGKPRNYIVSELLQWQELCLLDETALKGVVSWWAIRHRIRSIVDKLIGR